MLYIEPPEMDAHTREAALQGWSKWLVTHDHDKNKSSLSSFAKRYLKLGFLFGEPEFGLSPEVALPMYLNEAQDYVTIESKEIGKQLACTMAGGLYTADLQATPPPDAQWKCEWYTPEICGIISTEQGMRINCQQDAVPPVVSQDGSTAPVMPSVTVNLLPAHTDDLATSHWRLLEHGDGTIAIATHDETYVLGDNWQGSVTLSSPEPGPRPHWVVRKNSERGVWLQSAVTKRYLTIENGGFIMKDQPEASSLFSFEPVHGSKFTLSNAKHTAKKNADLADCLIKVFDNGNVIIKRDGQFFGECHWQGTFVGVGFGDHPYVWNFEPTEDGSIRICAKAAPADKKYLGFDGSSYTLDTPEDDTNSQFLWNIQAVDKKLTIGMRYGLLPKSILQQAQQKWPMIRPFRPTLAMEGYLQRPFANWRAWPLENQAPIAAAVDENQNTANIATAAAPAQPVVATEQPLAPPPAVVTQAPPPPPMQPAETAAPPPLPQVVHEVPQAVAQPPPEPVVEIPPVVPEAKAPVTPPEASAPPATTPSSSNGNEELGFKFFNAEEGVKFGDTEGTVWPEKEAPPAQPVTMNGRVISSDNTLSPTQKPFKVNKSDEEPRAPRVFTVDRR